MVLISNLNSTRMPRTSGRRPPSRRRPMNADIQVATAVRTAAKFSWSVSTRRRARRSYIPPGAGRFRALARKRSGNGMASIQSKYRTSMRYAVTLLTNCRALSGSAPSAPLNCCNDMAHLMGSSKWVSSRRRLRCYASIGSSRQWMRSAAALTRRSAPKWGSASAVARDWGLTQLADRLDEMA